MKVYVTKTIKMVWKRPDKNQLTSNQPAKRRAYQMMAERGRTQLILFRDPRILRFFRVELKAREDCRLSYPPQRITNFRPVARPSKLNFHVTGTPALVIKSEFSRGCRPVKTAIMPRAPVYPSSKKPGPRFDEKVAWTGKFTSLREGVRYFVVHFVLV